MSAFLKQVRSYSWFFCSRKVQMQSASSACLCLCENTERTKPALPASVHSAVLLCLSLQAVISLGVKTFCSPFAQGLWQRGLRPSLLKKAAGAAGGEENWLCPGLVLDFWVLPNGYNLRLLQMMQSLSTSNSLHAMRSCLG